MRRRRGAEREPSDGRGSARAHRRPQYRRTSHSPAFKQQQQQECDRYVPEVEHLAFDTAGLRKAHGFRQPAHVVDGEVGAAGRGRKPLEQRPVLLHAVVLDDAVLAAHGEARAAELLGNCSLRCSIAASCRVARLATASKRKTPVCVVS